MSKSVDFSAGQMAEIKTSLTDGRPVLLRPIRPSDLDLIREGIIEMSDHARYLRFFSTFKEPPESVVQRLGSVDGHLHIGWGARLLDGKECPAIGAVHAIRENAESPDAELAIAVLDEYQGYGLARMLIAAVLSHCSQAGIKSLEIHVLPENKPAKTLMLSLGAQRTPALDSVHHYRMDVEDALRLLKKPTQPQGVADVLAAFDMKLVA
ncbi:GNAT family N-acetyltransferase [Sphingorhabdus contaminans]|uniref:GNAT family N-acetyltransferase n=1 Tax=Sphingorhabdus contaminans TaxID=1343899 RepID=A0A553WJC7_9SPHN|nr:GNAT family N-acetyltransferase [Sphingorhabdus contaminans]TSB04734.1 GNAT family N-acetyltransferase [Sphingorhabdus contaminans]